jgi:ABC-type multidrug transport system ATPase subunit
MKAPQGEEGDVEVRVGGGGSTRLSLSSSMDRRQFTVIFKGLSWSIGKNEKKVTLIDDVTGFFEPCTLTALMVASGSGKRSLLDILSKRKTQGVIEGKIFYDEFPLTTRFARKNVGYVEQNPALIANLTCQEMLLYTAALQRPPSEDVSWQKGEIEKLMQLLGLLARKDVLVGDALTKGLSGGETKRVSIALGMIREPMVLYLDEPTSGLDSSTANEIMRLVRDIANDNRTVIASIHSPTTFCFGLFDNLFLLSSGRLAYFGRAAVVEDFLESLEFCREIKYSMSEWLVDLLAQPSTIEKITNGYRNSTLAQKNADTAGQLLARSLSPTSVGDLKSSSVLSCSNGKAHGRQQAEDKNSVLHELKWLMKFRTKRNYTSSAYLGSRIGDKVLFMLVIVSLYYDKGKIPESGVMDYSTAMQVIPAVLFMVVVLPAFGAAGYMPSLMLERPIFVRERADGNYRVFSYLLYKVVEEFLITIPVSLLFSVAIYYGVGLHGSLALFWLAFLVTQNIGIVLAYFVAAFAPTVDSANAFLPCYVTLCLFFVGLLIPYSDIPVYWQWFSYITFLRYSWSALMINEFASIEIPYSVLSVFSVPEDASKWAYLGYTACFYPLFLGLTYLVMSFRKYVSR